MEHGDDNQDNDSSTSQVTSVFLILKLDWECEDSRVTKLHLFVFLHRQSNVSSQPKKIRPCTLPKETQSLIELIFDNDMFKTSTFACVQLFQ